MSGRAVILFGHGSRDPAWRQPIEAVADVVARRDPHVAVRCAYLELNTPDLPTTVDELVGQGVDQINVLPMFLGVGRHAREDLPRLLQALRERHPQLRLHALPAVGEDPRMLDLMAELALSPPAYP